MTEQRRIPATKVYPFFTRQPVQPTPGRNALESVLVVPIYQTTQAFDPSLEPLEESRLAWFGATAETASYRSQFGDAHFAAASFENMRQGAALEAASTDVFAVIGAGPGRLEKRLNKAASEVTLFKTNGSVALGEFFDTPGYRSVTVAGADFTRIMAGVALPGTGMQTPPNFLTDQVVVARVGPAQTPVLVLDIDPTDPSTLHVQDVVELLDNSSVSGLTVTLFPRQFEVFPEGRASRVFLSSRDISGEAVDIGGSGVVWAWASAGTRNVSLVVQTGATDSVSPGVTGSGVVEITLTLATNTVAAARQLLQSVNYLTAAFAPVVEIRGDDASTLEVGTYSLSAVSADQDLAILRSKSGDGALEGARVILRPQPIDTAETVVSQVGPDWEIALGTDGTGALIGTLADIQAALVAANAPLELDLSTHSASPTAVPDYITEERNSLGVWYRAWNPAVLELADHQSDPMDAALRGGVTGGGVVVYGGLLPTTSADISAALYSQFRALRVDLSAKASLSKTGNRPGLVEVYRDSLEDIFGPVDATNPGPLAALLYTLASEDRRVFLLSPHEVSETSPWGTREAVLEALKLCKRRDVYHVGVMNDAFWVQGVLKDFVDRLGGTASAFLRKPMRVYIPTKNPTTAPDLPVVTGLDGVVDQINTSLVSASVDFVGAGVEEGDVLVFSSTSEASSTPVLLQDGRRGYRIAVVGASGDPFTIETETALPSAAGGPFEVLRPGGSLVNPDGSYRAQEAVEALNSWHRLTAHPRLIKHHVDSVRFSGAGSVLQLDGVYALAQYLGMIASRPQHLPMNEAVYPNFTRVEGSHSVYEEDQLEVLAGAGLTMPWQRDGNEEGRVRVFRDVSSDTSTRDFQRRTAGVSEDMLCRDVTAIVRSNMGPNLVTDELLDMISGLLDDLVVRYQSKLRIFRRLEVTRIIPINDEIRQTYGIDDSGVLVVIRKQHYEEATAGILNFIVDASNA